MRDANGNIVASTMADGWAPSIEHAKRLVALVDAEMEREVDELRRSEAERTRATRVPKRHTSKK